MKPCVHRETGSFGVWGEPPPAEKLCMRRQEQATRQPRAAVYSEGTSFSIPQDFEKSLEGKLISCEYRRCDSQI